MPSVSATRRASYTSSSEQQRPCTASGMPSCPASRRWFQSCMVRPMTSCPSARSMAATVEESTPPDMATAMVLFCGIGFKAGCQLRAHSCSIVNRGQLPEAGDGLRQQVEGELNILCRVLFAEAEAKAGAGYLWRQAHRGEHVGGLDRAG